jgi:hypothetical protein
MVLFRCGGAPAANPDVDAKNSRPPARWRSHSSPQRLMLLLDLHAAADNFLKLSGDNAPV